MIRQRQRKTVTTEARGQVRTLVRTVEGRTHNETQVTKSREDKKGGKTDTGCKAGIYS